jgi:hypothetical protein
MTFPLQFIFTFLKFLIFKIFYNIILKFFGIWKNDRNAKKVKRVRVLFRCIQVARRGLV